MIEGVEAIFDRVMPGEPASGSGESCRARDVGRLLDQLFVELQRLHLDQRRLEVPDGWSGLRVRVHSGRHDGFQENGKIRRHIRYPSGYLGRKNCPEVSGERIRSAEDLEQDECEAVDVATDAGFHFA